MNTLVGRVVRREWFQLVLLAIPVVAVFVAQPYVTQNVPMQWGLHGQVNWSAPKEWGLFVLPAIILCVAVLMMCFEHSDKNRVTEDGRPTAHAKAVRSIRLALSIVLIGVCFFQIATATGRHVPVQRLLPAGIALLFAFIGNLFGKLKPNPYVGIRAPWTLGSETVWRRTHRMAGHLWTISSIIVAAIALFGPMKLNAPVVITWFVMIVVIPLFVAWRAARDERMQNS